MTFKSSRSPRPRPTISTSALPDIVFILLFFFMVVTVLRDTSQKLRIHLPQASELEHLYRKELVNHIYIGEPVDPMNNAAVAVQINDAFVSRVALENTIKAMVAKKPEHLRPLLTASLHVDREVQMGVVTEVKTALRKAQQLKVNYAAMPELDWD